MELFGTNIANIWLFAGVALLILEAMGLPGAGFLFAGLSAITTGALIVFGSIDETHTIVQFICFFAATGIWAALLWKPIQKFRVHQGQKKFNNIVGDMAVVTKGGLTRDGGAVKWSGTTMTAQLAANAQPDTLAEGTKVTITDVEGTTLIVTPKI